MSRAARLTGWSLFGWSVLAFGAVSLGIFSLRYSLPKVPLAAAIPNFEVRRAWLVAHAIFASIALMSGPWQFLPGLRRRWIGAHRWTGRIYCAAVALGWATSVPIAAHAFGGIVTEAGFLTLGVCWIGSTAAGYFLIRRRLVEAHRRWMTISYALTAAAITFRFDIALFPLFGLSFVDAYRIASWTCWLGNLMIAAWLLRRRSEEASVRQLQKS